MSEHVHFHRHGDGPRHAHVHEHQSVMRVPYRDPWPASFGRLYVGGPSSALDSHPHSALLTTPAHKEAVDAAA